MSSSVLLGTLLVDVVALHEAPSKHTNWSEVIDNVQIVFFFGLPMVVLLIFVSARDFSLFFSSNFSLSGRIRVGLLHTTEEYKKIGL